MTTSDDARALSFTVPTEPLVLRGDTRGEGSVVVLLHGGGQSRHSWRQLARDLAARGHTAVTYDLRGHGDSDWSPTGTYAFTTHALDLTAVLAQVGQPALLVGASMGGIAALLAAGGHQPPPLVRGLVLVDVAVTVADAGVHRVQVFMASAPDGYASLAEAAAAVAGFRSSAGPRPSEQRLARQLRLGEDGRWRWRWDPKVLAQVGNGPALHALMAAAAGRLQVPTMLVRGANSDVVTPAGVAEMRRLIPGLRYLEIAGAGHTMAGQENDAFTAAVAAFAAGTSGSTGRDSRVCHS